MVPSEGKYRTLSREELSYALIDVAKKFVSSTTSKYPSPKDPEFGVIVEDSERGVVLIVKIECGLAEKVLAEKTTLPHVEPEDLIKVPL